MIAADGLAGTSLCHHMNMQYGNKYTNYGLPGSRKRRSAYLINRKRPEQKITRCLSYQRIFVSSSALLGPLEQVYYKVRMVSNV